MPPPFSCTDEVDGPYRPLEFCVYGLEPPRFTFVHILQRMGFDISDVNAFALRLDETFFRRLYTDIRSGSPCPRNAPAHSSPSLQRGRLPRCASIVVASGHGSLSQPGTRRGPALNGDGFVCAPTGQPRRVILKSGSHGMGPAPIHLETRRGPAERPGHILPRQAGTHNCTRCIASQEPGTREVVRSAPHP